MRASLESSDIDAIATAVAEKLAGQTQTNGGKLLFSESEAALRLGVSGAWLKSLRQSGRVIPHRGRRPVLYSPENLAAIKEFLAQ